jgi:hypothetical protein
MTELWGKGSSTYRFSEQSSGISHQDSRRHDVGPLHPTGANTQFVSASTVMQRGVQLSSTLYFTLLSSLMVHARSQDTGLADP